MIYQENILLKLLLLLYCIGKWPHGPPCFPMQDWDEYKTYKVESYLTGAFGISVVTRQDCLTACDSLGTLVTFARWRAQMVGASRLCENTSHAS